MDLENISLREAVLPDLDSMAKIHSIAFPGFFLTRMGIPFIKVYYSSVLNFRGSIALLACDLSTDQPLGFAVGFLDPQGFYRSFRHAAPRLILPALYALLRDPSLILQILRNVGRIGMRVRHDEEVSAAELSSIAVVGPGRGIGGMLLEAFVNRANVMNARAITLVTDAHNNYSVRKFYEVHGFKAVYFESRGERLLCHYKKDMR